jgi:hypothetical protein
VSKKNGGVGIVTTNDQDSKASRILSELMAESHSRQRVPMTSLRRQGRSSKSLPRNLTPSRLSSSTTNRGWKLFSSVTSFRNRWQGTISPHLHSKSAGKWETPPLRRASSDSLLALAPSKAFLWVLKLGTLLILNLVEVL